MAITINGSGTVTGLSVGGINDGAIAHADLATSTQPIFTSYAIICDQKSSGTEGGDFDSGAWRTRDLNTEIADPDGIVSISNNQFTLQAGTYLVKASAPAYKSTSHQIRLYNVTDSSETQAGTCETAHISYLGSNRSFVTARFTISGAKAFEIQHQCSHEVNTVGFGNGHSYTSNIFTQVEIYKEAS